MKYKNQRGDWVTLENPEYKLQKKRLTKRLLMSLTGLILLLFSTGWTIYFNNKECWLIFVSLIISWWLYNSVESIKKRDI